MRTHKLCAVVGFGWENWKMIPHFGASSFYSRIIPEWKDTLVGSFGERENSSNDEMTNDANQAML